MEGAGGSWIVGELGGELCPGGTEVPALQEIWGERRAGVKSSQRGGAEAGMS